jgi:hypothetical protein
MRENNGWLVAVPVAGYLTQQKHVKKYSVVNVFLVRFKVQACKIVINNGDT